MKTTGLWLYDDKTVIRRTQDLTPILERVQVLRDTHYLNKGDKLAASIPESVVQLYMNANGVSRHEVFTNPVHFRRMLNDPALKDYRIWEGRVSNAKE